MGQGLGAEDARQSLFLLKGGARESSGQGLQESRRRAPVLLSPSVLSPSFWQIPPLQPAAPCSPSTCPLLGPTSCSMRAYGFMYSPPFLALFI